MSGRCFQALIISIGVVQFPLQAQTFFGNGMAIPDIGITVESEIIVTGLDPASIDTIAFGIEEVCFSAEHTWIEDLDVRLVAPDGTEVTLVSGQGGDSDFYTNTCFRQSASTSILQAAPPFTGTYRPQGQLGQVNNGQIGNGTWKLRVRDTYPFWDQGSILDWNITFGDDPASYLNFQSSHLPIVILDTDGTTIPDGPKIPATMKIVDNGTGAINFVSGPFNGYDGHIGIEMRGWSSSVAAKKSYGIELWNEVGEEINASLLGLPAEQDWILSANYYDKSLLNNSLTYTLARRMGHYAVRHRHVEVVLNGQYIGIYVFMEKIKRDGDRVDIARLDSTDLSGDELTGGYIIKLDKADESDDGWTSDHPPASGEGQIDLFFDYPKPDRIMPEQAAYIQAYVDSFENALAGPEFTDPIVGYRNFIETNTFVDLFILNELSRNVDGYRLSTYLHKDRNSNGGKLRIGPVWDYDIAWENANYCDGSEITGWAYEFGDVCGDDPWQVPFWWERLLQDPVFTYELRCRWNELGSSTLSIDSLHHYCDSMGTYLGEAIGRNFTAWPILGVAVWPNPQPVPLDHAGEINELKDFIQARWNWLDQAIATLAPACAVGIPAGSRSMSSQIHPNPFTDHIWIDVPAPIEKIMLHDLQGRIVWENSAHRQMGSQRIDLPGGLSSGIYLLRITTSDGRDLSYRLRH